VRGADRLIQVLRDGLQDALLYRTLATLRRDVPLKETLEDLRYRGVPEERMAAFREATGWTRS
jgi:5'-3' exonuclease